MCELREKIDAAGAAVTLGKMSRRDFVQLAVASGMSVVAAQLAFAKAARSQPRIGGTFKAGLGHGSTTDSLDPATWNNGFTLSCGKSLMGATLVQVNQQNEAVPHVAESFEPSDQARRWVFRLRKDITFHNGKTLTADDVVATLRYHTSPESKSPARATLSGVIGLKADGPNTVIVDLKTGNADFPFLVSDGVLPIYPSVDGQAQWEKGIGAGPYILTSFEPGVKLVAQRNPNYFSSAWFESVEMLSILDVAARNSAFLSGEVHFIDSPDLKTLEMLRSTPDTEIYNVAGGGIYTAPMMCDVPPFDNVDVRNAIKWALNRQELVDKILQGYGRPGNDNVVGLALKYGIQPEPVHNYDPDRSKSLLKKAGIDTLKIDLSASDGAFPGGIDAALLMADRAREAGIEINVVREPGDAYWDNVWMKKPWSQCWWGTSIPTADFMLTSILAADSSFNDTRWNNARFNELLIRARSEVDVAKRRDLYAECQQLVHTDGGQLVLMFNNYVGALSTKIGHGDFGTNSILDGYMMYERWWMA